VIKLADKISNLRSILNSPPADWDEDRKREYFEWAKRVVEALSDPNPILKAEFERIFDQYGKATADRGGSIRSHSAISKATTCSIGMHVRIVSLCGPSMVMIISDSGPNS